jgi:hypothetical protein
MNLHLFKTRFAEMDAFKGRSQTMQGVWLAWAEEIDPFTLVMDLEGTDGRERGRMIHHSRSSLSLLFALAMSDMHCVDQHVVP